jgi:cytochrome c-type biogenesis protein CcmF
MIPEFGYGVLVISFAVALYGIGAAIFGMLKNQPKWVESARTAMLLTWPLITLAVLSLIYLLVSNHFEVAYVYNVTSTSMPVYLKITALWGGQAGSLLFWSWLMAAFAAAVTLRKWERDREFLPWVIVVTLVTTAFFLGLSVFIENPFTRYWLTADGQTATALLQPAGATSLQGMITEGVGLNPLLRHPGMIFHPPMLYLGFVGFVIPFAFAIAALVTGRTDDRWIRLTRRWTLVAWLCLSLGLILGSWWAHDVLGWGGYWGWDPVEISAFLPWLTGTAFLHSVMTQEKRGMFKQWNMVLIIITYSLVIYGTFLTRSGVLSSVHAFAQSAIGPAFFAFIGITFVVSLGLLLQRWNVLKSEGEVTSLLSRESLFLVNNFLFVVIAVICFLGVNYPIVSELFTGQKTTVGAVWYKQTTGPLFAALLLLMGIAPLSAWRISTWKTIGKSIWKPLLVSLLVMVLVFASGVRLWPALLGFWLVAFSACTTLYEYGRSAWTRAKNTGEMLLQSLWRLASRNRRRYGGYIIHMGVVLMALGIIGVEFFQTETQGTIQQGETLSLSGYTMTFKSLAEFDTHDGRNVARAVVTISKDGRVIGDLHPHRDYYYEAQQNNTIGDMITTPAEELKVILVDWQPISSSQATFKIYHTPLIAWLWIGGFVFILGTLLAAWPGREPEASPVRAADRRDKAVETV